MLANVIFNMYASRFQFEGKGTKKNPRGGGVLPYMGYIGMCRCEGYGFQEGLNGVVAFTVIG